MNYPNFFCTFSSFYICKCQKVYNGLVKLNFREDLIMKKLDITTMPDYRNYAKIVNLTQLLFDCGCNKAR